MLIVKTEFRKGILFVRLKGHLNKDTINKLNKKVTDVIKNNGIRNVVFNFSDLKSIDMKGIMNYVGIMMVEVLCVEIMII